MPFFCIPRSLLLSLLLIAAPLPATAEKSPTPSPRPPVVSAFRLPDAPPPDVPACPPVLDARFARAVLVGDSLADGLALHQSVPQMTVLARIGLTPSSARTQPLFQHDGKPATLEKKLPAMRPGAVYLWLGSNSLVGTDENRVLAEYGRLLERLIRALPETPFYLLEITPVRPLDHPRYAQFTNARIDAFNEGLRALAEKHGAYCLNTNALLRGGDGYLLEACAASDGIHLSAEAYARLAEYLYTHVLPEPAPTPSLSP